LARFWSAFGISGGGVEHPNPPPSVRHYMEEYYLTVL